MAFIPAHFCLVFINTYSCPLYGSASWSVVTRIIIINSLIWQVFSVLLPLLFYSHSPPPPVFLYFTHVQRHTGSFKGIQHQAVHLIGDCLVPFAIIAFQMYRFFIYCSGLYSLLDANITWLIIQSTVSENTWFPWTLPQISLISLL